DQNAGSLHLDVRREVLNKALLSFAFDFFGKEQGSAAPSSQIQQHARFAQARPMLRARLDDWFVHPRVRLDPVVSVLGNVARFSDLEPSIYSGGTEQTTREIEMRSNNIATFMATDWLTLATSFNIGGTVFSAAAPSLPTQTRGRVIAGGAVTGRG